MKKLFLVLLGCVLLASCGANSNSEIPSVAPSIDKSISLTLNNFEDYITIDATIKPAFPSPNFSGYYWGFETTVSTVGVNMYEFNEVKITVEVSTYGYTYYGSSNDKVEKTSVYLSLNKGGNASKPTSHFFTDSRGEEYFIRKAATIKSNGSYKVTSVSGSVEKV